MRAWEARALPLGDTRARPNASTTPAINARDRSIHAKRKARSRWTAPYHLPGGRRRHRPAARSLTDGSTPPTSPATSGGQRLIAPRFPADGAVIVAGRTRRQHLRYQRLAPRCRLAEQRLASCAARRRAMHFAGFDHGNKPPSCIP